MYECRAMRTLNLLLCSVLLSSVFAGAQTSAPAVKAGSDSSSNAGRTQFYESLDRIASHELTARRSALAEVKTRSEAEARQREVRKKISLCSAACRRRLRCMGAPWGPRRLMAIGIEKVIFDSQPNFPVTALLYLPDAKPGAPQVKLPGDRRCSRPRRHRQSQRLPLRFSTFARNGFAVLSYDPIGQGERLQYPDPGASRPVPCHASHRRAWRSRPAAHADWRCSLPATLRGTASAPSTTCNHARRSILTASEPLAAPAAEP